jgi:carboxyl-terminal processing protease
MREAERQMSGTRREFLGAAALLALGAGTAAAESEPMKRVQPAAGAESPAFDRVWELVRDRFYDARFNGVDWESMKGLYRPRAQAAGSREERAAVINDMLSKLNASHTRYYTPDEPAYYQLADIFLGALRHRGLGDAFPNGEVRYPGVGIFTEADGQGRTFVIGVIDGAPGAQAGLLVGDEILSADDQPFRPVGSFRGKVGTPVKLMIRRTREGAPAPVSVTPADLDPGALFLDGLKSSARVIAAGGARIGYVHIWSYAGRQYQGALQDLIGEGPLRDADALVWDLRDGWGGAQPDYLDLFNPRSPTMKVTARNGESELVGVKWRKPVAALINGGSRSGKEVLAYGFREYGLGELVGSRTEGAVLAATAFLVGDEGLLLLAVEDVVVDGRRLEGAGVEPTIPVAFDIRYAAGADPQLARAVELLARS